MPFSWKFERESYSMSSGRTIRLLPYGIENAFNAVYTWSVDGNEKQSGKDPLFVFTAEERAEPYRVTVTMKNEYTEISRPLTVRVAGPEGTYFRPSDAVSQISFNKVYEFTPAPGQFVNEDYDASTPEQACAYAEDRLSHEYYVSLGGFGGYIVVGFDHSIVNDGGYNFKYWEIRSKARRNPASYGSCRMKTATACPTTPGTNSKEANTTTRRPYRITK